MCLNIMEYRESRRDLCTLWELVPVHTHKLSYSDVGTKEKYKVSKFTIFGSFEEKMCGKSAPHAV